MQEVKITVLHRFKVQNVLHGDASTSSQVRFSLEHVYRSNNIVQGSH